MIGSVFEKLENLSSQITMYKKVGIVGAGINGIFVWEYLTRAKKDINIIAFYDNDINKQYNPNFKMKYGIECEPVENLKNVSDDVLILNAIQHSKKEVFQQLNNIGKYSISALSYIFALECNQIRNIYDIMSDKKSKQVIEGLIEASLSQDDKVYETIYEPNQYFAVPSFAYKKTDEVFVDCGAYVGDTIEAYLFNRFGTFKKIFAFEPGEKQMKAIKHRKNRLIEEWALDDNQIEIFPYAVGESNTETKMNIKSVLSSSNLFILDDKEEHTKVQTISIDSFFKKYKEKPTFIKADIEGYELELLKGAKQIIKKYKPLLAISIYHRPEDLWTIFTYIHSVRDDYKYSIRHHSSGGERPFYTAIN